MSQTGVGGECDGGDSKGEENMIVITTDTAAGFELKDLGPVKEPAGKLLRERIAPESSNETAQLTEASRKCDLLAIF